MLIIPEMANPLASDSSSSSMDDIEGQYLIEQREPQKAAQHGMQDGPHQIQADTRPDDVATGYADSDPIIISDDDVSDEDEADGENMEPRKLRFLTPCGTTIELADILTYHYFLIVISDEEDELVFWGPEDNGEPHDETIVLKDLRVMLERCDAMVPGECVLILVKKVSVWFGVLWSR